MIYTTTLSPAYDCFANSESLLPGRENLITDKKTYAGGKGINVSRALAAYGVQSIALVLLGENNCADYERGLSECAFESRCIKVPGTIRENLTVSHDGTETRICTEGFSANSDALEKIFSLFTPTAQDTVIISGRMPASISREDALLFLRRIRDTGARLVVDSKSFTLKELGEIGVWLAKPNREEIRDALGVWFSGPGEIKKSAEDIRAFGIDNVIVSLDSDGAALITRDSFFTSPAPKIKLVSGVGAGDSMAAGFVFACSEGYGPEAALKYAVAFGSAACLAPGVLPPAKKDIDAFLQS